MGDGEDGIPASWPFTVWNDFEIGDPHPTFPNLHIFDVDLVLNDLPTVGDIRASIAAHMKVPVSDICLKRRFVRSRRGAIPMIPIVDEISETEPIPSLEKDASDILNGSEILDDDKSPFNLTRKARTFITALIVRK